MSTLETSAASSSTSTQCPKCGNPLTNAAGLGWCPACGYCRSLEETPTKQELERNLPTAKDAGKAARSQEPVVIPIWAVFLAVVTIALAVGSYVAGVMLEPDSLPRALWTSLQLAAGVLVLFVGQFVALVRIAPYDDKLGFKDALVPFRLYGQVFKRLPAMGFSVCTLAWGLTLIVAASCFIGGLDHWFTYLKSKKDREQGTSIRRQK